MKRFERIEGSLTNPSGDAYPVRLEITVAVLQGSYGIEDEHVAEVRLLSRVPDGEYYLDYFYEKPVSRRLRVKHNSLLNSQA